MQLLRVERKEIKPVEPIRCIRTNSKAEYHRNARSAAGTLYGCLIWAYPGCMDEHRIASRHRVLKAGTIEFGGGSPQMNELEVSKR